ncbi:DHA2 family efflux MFS transporter permease subunit [Paenibacillus hamazuiensis]|uniref:DHA2 family efflux MFS transporter permease subunit n=1 Tax=Paenibacillus hamazuiensis TaxID=2936508 RepID=UPI00200BB46D|nr:DHA2 family efflux MFS transporter permease subunit [Paenibacillus hamazuiensis]
MSLSAKSESLARPAAAAEIRPRPRLLLAVMLLSVFMAVANIFIVNVATPSIQRGLHSGFSELQFVITGYTLAYAVALIIGGRLGDRFGRKRMLLIGVAGFTLSSLFCGLSSGVSMLIMFRVVQGLSAALIAPQVLSLIQENYAPEKRGGIFGMYGAAQGLAATTGQLIGGFLLRLNPWELDWRTVFFFSVPIGIAIMAMTPFIPESSQRDRSKLDWVGAALIAAGLLMLVYPLVQGQKEGWPIGILAVLVLSLPVFALFVRYEKKLLERNSVPFMNVNLFRERAFSIGLVIVVLLMCSQAAYFLIFAYLLQIGLGFSALQAGTIILPMGIGYFMASLFSPKVSAKLGPHVLTAGAALTVTGYLALAMSVHATGPSGAVLLWVPALLVLGIGQGLIASPITTIVLSRIRAADIGSASGILTTGMQVASAVGIGLIGVVWLSSLSGHADAVGREVEQQLRSSLPAASAGPGDAALTAMRDCYPLMARGGDPSAIPAGCRADAASPAAKQLYESGIRLANAQNYADSFLLCLYVLAAVAACMLPFALVLARIRKA